jgi:hypothetical protein
VSLSSVNYPQCQQYKGVDNPLTLFLCINPFNHCGSLHPVMMITIPLSVFALFTGASALPHIAPEAIQMARQDLKLEWTALGDSYASGVGAGNYLGGRRCLRYGSSYPNQLNSDSNMTPTNHIFHNCVCSGAHSSDVDKYQFYDKDTSGEPNWQYGEYRVQNKLHQY